ncbi:hypothetical protein J0383_21085 [Flavobacterium endoglycinae]|uniref:DUF1349 domain-containing protein n=1 Tax=Flavobacterium endoglycinae TaxID=2816357 RepID=A0ABX7QDB7_9FLAO|nr:hypothetical protein [Flavobacterium endoglycinae]QSW88720.1 hypothetical protein J0383_21085 [Flavobacterium endoglycinae]
MKTFELEKNIWTVADFEEMGWHDCSIHAFAIDSDVYDDFIKSDLLLDIDYIFKWVLPENTSNYSFWVAPCTLTFIEVTDLKIQYASGNSFLPELEISHISREEKIYENGYKSWHWKIELVGDSFISFDSIGYEQVVKRAPSLTNQQAFTITERGGINF